MEPIFSIPYSEFMVMEKVCRYLKKQKGFSPYVPASRQQKGVDFLIHNQQTDKLARFQVKASRSYHHVKDAYQFNFWFSNFTNKYCKGISDYYCLLGVYSSYSSTGKIAGKGQDIWSSIVLCLPDDDVSSLLQLIKTKKDPKKADRFFAIGFDDPSKVFGTRGFNPYVDLSKFLLEPMISKVEEFMS